MARYKAQDHNSLLLPVVLSEQIIPGSQRRADDPDACDVALRPTIAE